MRYLLIADSTSLLRRSSRFPAVEDLGRRAGAAAALLDPAQEPQVEAVVALREDRMVRRRVPQDRNRAAVLGDGLEGLDGEVERRLRIEAEVALLGERRVHQDERQLPGARLAPPGVPEPVRVRRPRAQARAGRPADARVVAQPGRAQLRREPVRRAPQVVVPQALRRIEQGSLFRDPARALTRLVRGVEADLAAVFGGALDRARERGLVALRVAVVRVFLAREEEARR